MDSRSAAREVKKEFDTDSDSEEKFDILGILKSEFEMTNPADLRSGDAQKVANSGYKLTAFSPKMPAAWFAIVEADMQSRQINDDHDKFSKVLSALGVENTNRLTNELAEIPTTGKYTWLKTIILREFETLIEDQFDKAFSAVSIATIADEELPRKLMQRMLDNTSAEMKKTREFKILFIRQMPVDIRPLIASYDESDPKKFAILCDKALTNYKATKSVFNVNTTGNGQTGQTWYGGEQGNIIPEVPDYGQNLAEDVAQLRLEVNHLRRGARGQNYGRGGFRGSRGRGFASRGARFDRRNKPADTCFFHWKYGAAAMNCEAPCRINGVVQGNATGRV